MKRVILSLIAMTIFGLGANAQTTEFTYQGSLKDGPASANASYDFEFRLFTVDTGGTALNTLQRLAVSVANGAFSVKLDFGAQFPGTLRYLEIERQQRQIDSLTKLVCSLKRVAKVCKRE